MADVTVRARLLARRDTTEKWNEHLEFIPYKGEIIVYTDYRQKTDDDGNTINIPGIKIGDGLAYCVDLPFINDAEADDILKHISDTEIHVTPTEKAFWNNKLNVAVLDDELILNRQ